MNFKLKCLRSGQKLLNQTGTGQAEPAPRGLPFEKGAAREFFFSDKRNLSCKFSNMISIIILGLVAGFYGFANIPSEETNQAVATPSVLDKLGVNDRHYTIKESDKQKIKAYIIDLLDQVFPLKTDVQHPSLKAKKELDEIVGYINRNDNEMSRFMIEVFVDSLFYIADSEVQTSVEDRGQKPNNYIAGYRVRTNSVVFVSDMIQNPVLQSLLLSRIHQALNVPDSSNITGPTSIMGKTFPSKNKTPTITPEAKMALYALADIRPPVGKKDFELQKIIFDIMKKMVEGDFLSSSSFKYEMFEVTLRALFNLNPSYPDFDLFLAKIVMSATDKYEIRLDLRAEIALRTLEEIQLIRPLNIKIYRKFRKIYNRGGPTEMVVRLIRITDNMARVFEPEKAPKQVGKTADNPADKVEITLPEDKNLFRVPPSVAEHVENLTVHLPPILHLNGRTAWGGSAVHFAVNPQHRIQHLKNLIGKAPSSREFLAVLFHSLEKSSYIYHRALATDIINGMSFNENALEAFFKEPRNDIDPADNEHRLLAMRLWTLMDPESPRRQNMLESAIALSGFKDSDTLREEARNLLKKGIISIKDINFDKQGIPVVSCQYSFGGRAI